MSYSDNFFAAQTNRQAGVRLNSDVNFHATVPAGRLFLAGQYDYAINYPQDLHRGGVEQTHNLSASANYTVTPRLGLGLTETYISSLQPGLVTGPGGVPISISNFGSYIYEAVGGSANYALSARWIVAVNGSWDIWRYSSAASLTNGDHEDLSAQLSLLYALDSRTQVGLNYQYSQDVYVFPGTNNALNGYMDTVYLSLTRRFNPRLSLTLNGGYSIRESQDGTQSSSPSALGSIVYNYGPSSAITLTMAESLSEANIGVTRSFSAQQNTSLSLQANHRLTARLSALADFTYTYSTFTAPVAGTSKTSSANEQSETAHVGLSYSFREWLSAGINYYHNQISSNTSVVAPYSSNQIYLAMTATY
jgi:hypothetical protein